MRLIDADALIIELEKDEALFDNEATVAHENSIKYTDNYAKIMWSRANGIRDAIIEVYDAPTIDAVSVVHGEWLIEKTWYDNYIYRCNCCGWHECHAYPDVEPYNFCPNCGAMMKGADDE